MCVCGARVYTLVGVQEATAVSFKGGGHSGLIGRTIRTPLAGASAWEHRASKPAIGANIRIPRPPAGERGSRCFGGVGFGRREEGTNWRLYREFQCGYLWSGLALI